MHTVHTDCILNLINGSNQIYMKHISCKRWTYEVTMDIIQYTVFDDHSIGRTCEHIDQVESQCSGGARSSCVDGCVTACSHAVTTVSSLVQQLDLGCQSLIDDMIHLSYAS